MPCADAVLRGCGLDAIRSSLNERYLRSVKVDSLNVGLSCQNADVLPERGRFDGGT